MNDAEDIALVCQLLERTSLHIERIPESKQKPQCDLRAQDGAECYLIEVKGFHDDADIKRNLDTWGEYDDERSLVYYPAVRGRIDDAVEQLRKTADASREEFWLVALLNRNVYGADVATERILGTLYGTRPIIYAGSSGAAEARDCLYFSHSSFVRHQQDLDGAIVIGAEGVMMCLNDHSDRCELLRRSALGRYFANRDALNDSHTLEVESGFLIADCDIDRRNKPAVLQNVARKYGLRHAISFEPTEYSAMVLVPNEKRHPGKGTRQPM
jgi:hypothetical protein